MIKQLAIAAFVASLVPVIPFAGFAIVEGGGVAWEWALSAWFVAAAHILVLGIPAFLLLVRSGRATRLSVTLSGFVLGFVPWFAYSGLTTAGVQVGLVFGVLGALCAWVFCWVLSRGEQADPFAD